MKTRGRDGALFGAVSRWGTTGCLLLSLFGVNSAANATVFDPATALLGTLTITGATVSDSIYNDDFKVKGGFGDANVKSFVTGEFGTASQTAATIGSGGNCGGGPTTCSGNGATYSGKAADIFAIHWGGGRGGNQPLLAIEFSKAVTSFTISGFSHGVSFIRAYSNVSATPLPAALPLFAAGLGVIGLLGRRRKRNASGQTA
jgi:hypothetical protein